MRIVKETVKIDPIFKDLDGIRILHIGDLHLRGRNKKIEAFLNKLSKESFDLLFITGDVVDDYRALDQTCAYLQKLRPRIGAWFVLGNHDEYKLNFKQLLFFRCVRSRTKKQDIEKLLSSLEKIGIRTLPNKTDRIKIGNVSLKITGITIPLGLDRLKPTNTIYKKDMENLEEFFSKDKGKKKEFSVVLTHLPDMVGAIKNMKADLYFAGHTHGGQVRLPIIGPVFTFSRVQRRYNRGLFKISDGSYMNVTAGIGHSRETPFRLFCPPEATIITLKCQ